MNINFEITKDGNSEIALTEHSVKTLMSDSISETGINLRNSKRMREVTVEWVINVEFLTIGAREVEDTIKIADFAVILEYADCCKDLNYKMVDNTGNFVREKGLDAVYVAYL